MAAAIKRLLVGKALRTEQATHERLSKKTALAVFSSDALSSTAYATEEILLVLAASPCAHYLSAAWCWRRPVTSAANLSRSLGARVRSREASCLPSYSSRWRAAASAAAASSPRS
jgi:hypothetical protein